MLVSQFDYLCQTFGDPSIPETDRWKSIKYIYVENPLPDFQTLLKEHNIIYINNASIGAGFYIISPPNSNLEPINKGLVVSFVPLDMVDKISFILDDSIIHSGDENVSNLNARIMSNSNDIIEGYSSKLDENLYSDIIE